MQYVPDYDPQHTRALHDAIRDRKRRALHALIKKGVYVDATAFDLARGFLPDKVAMLIEHQRKRFYA